MTFPHPEGNETTRSYWMATTPTTVYPRLDEDARADVLIVGGGIVGVTTAYLLAKEGKSVLVLDRERLATAETGHTTAHLQVALDTRLKDLVARFGHERTRLAWDSQMEAVRMIEQVARDERIACDLQRLDAFLYSPKEEDAEMLEGEMRLAREIGYEAEPASPDDVPFPCEAAIRFPDQGKFHVRKYLLGVARAAERRGVRFFEGTEVREAGEGRARTAEGRAIEAGWIVQATNQPFTTKVAMHTKLYNYRTYAIAADVPKGIFSDALYWDTLDPYHYTRVEPQGARDLVILGGEDHAVGAESDTEKHHGALADYLRTATEDFALRHRWSGQVVETEDDFPFIGQMPGGDARMLVATGDSGTGMTNGTLAGIMLSERILGRGTPWDEMYDPARVHYGAGPVAGFLKHRAKEVERYAKTALGPADVASALDVAPGHGAIVRVGLRKIAVSRGADGQLRAVEARCTHLGCEVKWNGLERSWDCPCHGSRFSPQGEVLHGPAAEPLAEVPIGKVLGEREAVEHVPEEP